MRQYCSRPKPSLSRFPQYFFASARFPHSWVRLRKALALSAEPWNSFSLDRPPESPTSSKAQSKSPSVHCLRRNDRDTRGFRSPKSATLATQSQRDASSPFRPSCGACRIESRRIHGGACSRTDCILVRMFVFGETCGQRPN